ncbi:MAG: ABC transporter ATP-binding protein [Planctomycetes bacterium]|nr:ABC transporter ATP-binding protein [Planctomycetota bacterium]
MPPPPPLIEIRGLAKEFGSGPARVEALRDIDLTIEPGELVAIMGPSGAGKSTLLYVIGGLERPTRGVVRVGGTDASSMTEDELTLLRRRSIGFVFQSFNLLDGLSAQENVALPLLIAGTREKDALERAAEALKLVGLDARARHLPGELSGGEQQRVAVARALVTEPLLILADEPTGNLDSASGSRLISLLRALADDRRQTILLVTHDPRFASSADRLVHLEDGRVLKEERRHAGAEPRP